MSKSDLDDIEYELRKEINELNSKLQREREKNLKQLEDFSQEKTKLQEATNNAETKAKDFEYLLAELEYKVNAEKASSKEDNLRQEIKKLKDEIDQMGSHHDMIKSETTDLVSELKALRIQLQEANQKISTQEFLIKQNQLDKDKQFAKNAQYEKEISSLNDKIREKEKNVIDLTKKNVEIEALHAQVLDRKDQEFLQVLKKYHMEMQILKDQLEKAREDSELLAIRTRNETCLLPQFDHFNRPASNTLNFEMPHTINLPTATFVSSEVSDDQGKDDEIVLDKDKELELPDDFRRDSVKALMVSSGFVRRETQDSKGISSTNHSRRGSTMSNRLALKQLAFGSGKNSDEKLVAEVNELKIKLKEAHQETTTKVNSLLVW